MDGEPFSLKTINSGRVKRLRLLSVEIQVNSAVLSISTGFRDFFLKEGPIFPTSRFRLAMVSSDEIGICGRKRTIRHVLGALPYVAEFTREIR